jgi:predicted thioesterase
VPAAFAIILTVPAPVGKDSLGLHVNWKHARRIAMGKEVVVRMESVLVLRDIPATIVEHVS